MRLPVSKPLYLCLRFLGFPVAWDVSAGVILFFETAPGNREYLLIRYPSGHFDFARGHLEGTETKKEAALREVEEETGIQNVKLFNYELHSKFFYYAKGQEYERRKRDGKGTIIFKEVFMYPGQVENQTIRLSHEHTEFVWLPYKEAYAKVTFNNAKAILQKTEEYIKNLSTP